jgi:hypothetical protein
VRAGEIYDEGDQECQTAPSFPSAGVRTRSSSDGMVGVSAAESRGNKRYEMVDHRGSVALQRGPDQIALDTRPIQVKVQSGAATEGEGPRFHGWGGALQMGDGPVFSTRGYFTAEECKMHVNALELLGCWCTARSLLGLLVPKHLWHKVHLSCELGSVVAIKHAKVAVSRSLNLSKIGSSVSRLEGGAPTASVSPASGRSAEREGRRAVERGVVRHRMEAQRGFVPKHPKSLEGGHLHRPFREQTKSPVSPVLHLGTRLGSDGGRQFVPPLDLDEDGARVPSPVLHVPDAAKSVDGVRQRLHFGSPSMARPAVVANADGEHHRDTPSPAEREVDHDRPGAQANVEGPSPPRRVSFIREFALREGTSAEALQAIWGAGKNGCIASYDAHFVRFEEHHGQVTAGSGRFSPRSINAGTLVGFLKSQEDDGKSERHT